MIIRQEQLDVLQSKSSRSFERRAIAHLHTAFPEWAAWAGDERLLLLVHLGFRRARRWNLTGAQDICRFVDLMVAISPEFDDDPRFPWVRRILGQKHVSATTRIGRVHECFRQYFARMASTPER